MHDGTRAEQGDYIMDHLEGVVTFNISLSSSQKDGYSKFKVTIYPALKKQPLMLCSVSPTCPQHMSGLQTLCLKRPGNNLHFEESTGLWIHVSS